MKEITKSTSFRQTGKYKIIGHQSIILFANFFRRIIEERVLKTIKDM